MAAYSISSAGLAATATAEFSAVLEADEHELLRRYQADNPRYCAFHDSDGRVRPLDERVAESELEKLTHTLEQKTKLRRQMLVKSTKAAALPPGLSRPVPHAFEARAQRQAAVQAALRVESLQPYLPVGQLLLKELAWASEPRQGIAHTLTAVRAFHQRRVVDLPRKALRYLERWATYVTPLPGAGTGQTVLRHLPDLRKKLFSIAQEHAFSTAAAQKIGTYLDHLSVLQHRGEFGGPGKAGGGGGGGGTHREFADEARLFRLNVDGAIPEELSVALIKPYFNDASTHVQLRRRVDRFVAHGQVLAMARRYDFYQAAMETLLHGGPPPLDEEAVDAAADAAG